MKKNILLFLGVNFYLLNTFAQKSQILMDYPCESCRYKEKKSSNLDSVLNYNFFDVRQLLDTLKKINGSQIEYKYSTPGQIVAYNKKKIDKKAKAEANIKAKEKAAEEWRIRDSTAKDYALTRGLPYIPIKPFYYYDEVENKDSIILESRKFKISFKGKFDPVIDGIICIENYRYNSFTRNIDILYQNDSIKSIRYFNSSSSKSYNYKFADGNNKYWTFTFINNLTTKFDYFDDSNEEKRRFIQKMYFNTNNNLKFYFPNDLDFGELISFYEMFTKPSSLIDVTWDPKSTDPKCKVETKKINKKTWTNYSDSTGNVYSLHFCNLTEKDNLIQIERLDSRMAGGMYSGYTKYSIKPLAKIKHIYNPNQESPLFLNCFGDCSAKGDDEAKNRKGNIVNYSAEVQILKNGLIDEPLKVEITYDSITQSSRLKVFMFKELLAEGTDIVVIPFSKSMSGTIKTYSKKVKFAGINGKIALSIKKDILHDGDDYFDIYKYLEGEDLDVMESIFRKKLFITPEPLSTTTLGTFDPVKKSFSDRTPDYLYQKVKFQTDTTENRYSICCPYYKYNEQGDLSDRQKINTAYQFLPNGNVFDSINNNINMNEFGEIITSSYFKDYANSKQWFAFYNKVMDKVSEDLNNSMMKLEKENNVCSFCNKSLENQKTGFIKKDELI